MPDLDNKVIVLTGANGLLGRNFLRSLASEGAQIACIDKKFDEDLLTEFTSNENIKFYVIDITDEIQLSKCFDGINNHFGKIDGLVNNAAINPKVEDNNANMSGLEGLNYSDWKLELDVGLFAAINCSKIVAQYLVRNENGGSIVNIGSDYGHLAPKQSLYSENSKKPITYSVVKFGIIGATRYLAAYLADKNIRVNALSPGGILNGQNMDFIDRLNLEIPLARMAKPDEMSGALIFLLSDKSSYVTGLDLIVDGGRSIW